MVVVAEGLAGEVLSPLGTCNDASIASAIITILMRPLPGPGPGPCPWWVVPRVATGTGGVEVGISSSRVAPLLMTTVGQRPCGLLIFMSCMEG